MARRYARFNEMLAPLGLGIAQITLSSRYAWQLRLKDGMVLELGREQMEERLARFVAAYPQYVATMKSPAKYVDLRYRNGFAARVAAGMEGDMQGRPMSRSRETKNLMVGLDIGTSKIVTIVGEITPEGTLEVIGVGMHDSSGMKKGMVVNIDATVGRSSARWKRPS